MRSSVLDDERERTWILVFDRGDEVMETLTRFARDQGLEGGHFTGIGAFAEVTLGFFEPERRAYRRIPLRGQVEVLSLTGDIALSNGVPTVHAHVVVGRSDGAACGGHLLEGRVWPTLELVLQDTARGLLRRHDPETGLALIDPEASRLRPAARDRR